MSTENNGVRDTVLAEVSFPKGEPLQVRLARVGISGILFTDRGLNLYIKRDNLAEAAREHRVPYGSDGSKYDCLQWNDGSASNDSFYAANKELIVEAAKRAKFASLVDKVDSMMR